MGSSPRVVGGIFLSLLMLVLAAGFFLGGTVSLVPWRDVRAVVIESDDWGLAGFIPRAGALDGIDRQQLSPGRFPAVYWGSTLEDSTMVADLAGILAAARGWDGLSAVMQPNYVLGSLSWRSQGGRWGWRRFLWPEYSPAYQRPGLTTAVSAAMADGVWYPELHALYHYDPTIRKAVTRDDPVAREAARRGVMLFPGSEQARELAPGRPLGDLAGELDLSLAVFATAFGRPVASVIAPDYTWDSRVEDLWSSRGLRIIQAKREQRFMGRRWGTVSRIRKVVQQRWEKQVHRDRVYLERNCRFEPVQNPDPGKVVDRCLAQVQEAWKRGEPAIIEAHRINFVHTEPKIVKEGQEALRNLLAGIIGRAGAGPLFLTDEEVASLARSGVSACRRGNVIVVRNLSGAGRVVPLTAAGYPGKVCWLPARTVVVMESGNLRLLEQTTVPR